MEWIKEMPKVPNSYLHKSRLYHTKSNYYLVGRTKNRSVWRVLKIEKSDSFELNVTEDSTLYTESECSELLQRINLGNKSTGGLKFVTPCYGIVGFIKFLGPYYMLLITQRRKVGVICGHAVYSVAQSEILPLSDSTKASGVDDSKNENRYKKLLSSVDLTRDFYFSYSYHLMHSLQKNLSAHEAGQHPTETMFVWNEFLTTGIHNQLQNKLWTVSLIYGFFKQVKLLVSEKEFKLTLIARRSRHYAGTRYLKRGVNAEGRVANDVETEQIVFEDVSEGRPVHISSIVQNRGSIPLFWSQETSRLNMKPDIVLSKNDRNYEATRLHFKNLYNRYGNPIIILNLVKTREKKPRESLLRLEFANAIESINRDLPVESRLKFLHWDLNKYSRKSKNVLALLGKVATYALNLTGIFYCQVVPNSKTKELFDELLEHTEDESGAHHFSQKHVTENGGRDILRNEFSHDSSDTSSKSSGKPPRYQTGVLRTNCIDCLDRTNVAQFAYGWAALGHQLHALGSIDVPTIELDTPLADDLMGVYERMGDTLALQYGGSAAHNKIFSQRRGQWKAASQSQEFFRTLQRYYSNAYMDAQKQDAINVFLGHYQPQLGRPALWELDSDRHQSVGSHCSKFLDKHTRGSYQRSLSDGNIPRRSKVIDMEQNEESEHRYREEGQANNSNPLSESSPEISTCESDSSYPRYAHSMPRRQLFVDTHSDDSPNSDRIFYNKRLDSFNCSNFLDVDWISSSTNSCEDEPFEMLTGSPFACQSSENVVKGMCSAACDSESCIHSRGEEQGVGNQAAAGEYPEAFVKWVMNGGMFLP